MDMQSLVNTINLERHEFSLLLVDPKPQMVEWVSTFSRQKGWEIYKLYYPEGNLVVVIPKIDRFSAPGEFEHFIERMKPRLLELELRRFGATPADLGHPATKETFDRFFELSIRESAMLMSDFKNPEELLRASAQG